MMTQTQTGFGHGNCQYCGASTRGGHVCPHMPTAADPADLGDAVQTGRGPNDEDEHPSSHLVPAPYAGPFGEDYTIMPGGGGFSFDPDDTGYVTIDEMWDAFNDHWPTHDFGPRQEREMEALDEAGEGTLVTGSAYGRALIIETQRETSPFSVYTDDGQSGVISEIRTDTDNEADDCAHDFVNAVEYADWVSEQEAADEEERESQYLAGQEW